VRSICAYLLILFTLSACAISKPCTEGGDISWNPKIVGDKRCAQKTNTEGRTFNQGKFQQYYQTTGTIALEGNFEEGKKDGVWLYYAEDKHLVAAKFFDKGVEKTPPLEVQKKIDLIIQQKAGVK
jgi:antitoxin component YwqK of YwqJK toxin-antitoxin module